jgi:hypothetical protein
VTFSISDLEPVSKAFLWFLQVRVRGRDNSPVTAGTQWELRRLHDADWNAEVMGLSPFRSQCFGCCRSAPIAPIETRSYRGS